jgi:hypothetical protein
MNALDKNKPADIDKLNAHLKVMRAFFLYHAMDNFGRIPLDTSFNSSRLLLKAIPQEAFNFIEKELLQNIPLLDNKSNSNYGVQTDRLDIPCWRNYI